MNYTKVKGEIKRCSVCGENFKVTDDTCYIINGGYTCSWKCFLNFVKSDRKIREAEKQKVVTIRTSDEKDEQTVVVKKKRGRPPKKKD